MLGAIMTGSGSDEFRAWVVMVALTILTTISVCALVIIARHTKNASLNARKLHLQQANIIAMLLRAGFRPAKGRPDWNDDAHETQVMRQSVYDTQVDPRSPWRVLDD